VSFGFYGPFSNKPATYRASIKIQDDLPEPRDLAEASEEVIALPRDIFHVKFPKPVPVQANKWYRAWFAVKVSAI